MNTFSLKYTPSVLLFVNVVCKALVCGSLLIGLDNVANGGLYLWL